MAEGFIRNRRYFPKAIGGTETVIEQDGKFYRVHTYTDVGTDDFEVLRGGKCDVLVVAGGGGGAGNTAFGRAGGGGGGAGGLVFANTYGIFGKTTISIEVGDGGEGINQANEPAENGENSVFGDLTANGGGAGIITAGNDDTPGNDGGCGGGARLTDGSFGKATQPNTNEGAEDFGNDGGFNSADDAGAGGGGADTAGQNISGDVGGDGGDGRYYGNIFNDSFGDNGYFAGGGGGGGNGRRGVGGKGGIGGGGDGESDPENTAPQDGAPNTGGGGGGGGSGFAGGAGGSGIVIIRYRITQAEFEAA